MGGGGGQLPAVCCGCNWRRWAGAEYSRPKVQSGRSGETNVPPRAPARQPVRRRRTGVALLGHQVRRAILLDPRTRLPCLEETDAPFESFLAECARQGLHTAMLRRGETCSLVDSDPMCIVGIARDRQRLLELERELGEGGHGGAAQGGGGVAAQDGCGVAAEEPAC